MAGIAEAGLVLGLVSSIIAIVDATKKVYDAAHDATDPGLPEAFREVHRQLPTVESTLILVQSEAKSGNWDAKRTSAVKNILESCEAKSQKLEVIFKKVIPEDAASRTDRYIAAVRTLGKGSQVEALMKGILNDMTLVAGNQVAGLAEAIRAISEIQPSLTRDQMPDEDSTYTHYGSGDINHAEKNQYINSGEGSKQWNMGDIGSLSFVFTSRDKTTCLQALSFIDMKYRNIELLKDITPRTCDWILQRPEFEQWRVGSNDLLWIKGNPGTGKSSLLAFVFSHLIGKTKKSTGRPQELFLSFFFHNRGSELQKTRSGMFRTLLFQILRAIPEACGPLLEDFLEKQESTAPGDHIEWNETEYSLFLLQILSNPGISQDVVMFVDALDEAGATVANELIAYFYKLLEVTREHGVHLKICFSSRPYPILIGVSQISHMTVEDHNIEGITLYIKDCLSRLSPNGTVRKHHTLYEVEKFISGRAKGVFQWARLVLEALAKADSEREPLNQLWDRLRAIPRDLYQMYQHLLQGVLDEGYETEAVILFQLVCFALTPLSVYEIRDAMAFDGLYLPWKPVLETTFPYLESDAADFEIRIKLWSAGLIEVKERDNTTTVQVIHQTVAEFLQDIRSLQTLFSHYSSASDLEYASHNRLAKICFHYLGRNSVTQMTTSSPQQTELAKLPFLDYAVKFCFVHANKAERGGVSQADIVDLLGDPGTKTRIHRFRPGSSLREGRIFQVWLALYNLQFGPPSIYNGMVFKGTTLVHIAASEGLHETLTELAKRGVKLNELDGTGQSALHYAVRGNNIYMVKRLLNLPFGSRIDINAESHMITRDSGESSADVGHITALMIAVWNSRVPIIGLLLAKKAKIKVYNSGTYGYLATEKYYDFHDIAALLIEDRKAFQSLSLVQALEEEEDIRTTAFLIRQGADTSTTDRTRGMTALHIAILAEDLELINLLLHVGADLEASARVYQPSTLIKSRQLSPRERLRAVAAAFAMSSRTALQHTVSDNQRIGHRPTASQTQITLVDISVAKFRRSYQWTGPNPTLKTHISPFSGPRNPLNDPCPTLSEHGLTPLRIAASTGNQMIVEALLNAGSKVDPTKGGPSLTPLEAAKDNGYDTIVEMLKDAGSPPPRTDGERFKLVQDDYLTLWNQHVASIAAYRNVYMIGLVEKHREF